ncbi:MFS transporter [Actinomadura nitritigenes]|uniref:MFS transporter n=1 Tax=Actinomadura nitritigenes TaxID=134602 RepID=A0ABS3R8Y6_9ACTN|nr:MFS transporter [Actinomadura nitritigenes]MBO2442683.1 MFS transporter [Actinomadura nitritigenes]
MATDEPVMLASPASPTAGRRPLTPRGVAFATMFGNAIELYDFIIYSYAAGAVFGPLFFPTDAAWVGTLLAFSTQALAFFVRPLGAIIFGRVGDRWGRRAPVLLSLAFMGSATVLVGLLPTYAVVGAAAPILLTVLRLLQGVAIGGEYPGAVVVAVEHAPPHHKTLYGAFPQIGNMLGSLLGGIVLVISTLAVSPETWRAGAWRVPFLLSAVLLVIGLAIRTRLAETPEFVRATEGAVKHGRVSFGVLLRRSAQPLVIATLLWIGPLAFSYAFLNSVIAFVSSWRTDLAPVDAQIGLIITSVLLITVVTVTARYGDRLGPDRVVLASGIWFVVWAVPSYALIDAQVPVLLWTGMAVGAIGYGAFGGVAPRLISLLFPVEFRFIGVGVCIALSGIIAGAVLPIPALAWVGETGGSSVPLMLMVIVAGLATVAGWVWLRAYRKRHPEVVTAGSDT